jgi:hypothetical protein
MPLALGGLATDRGHVIAYDQTSMQESLEAAATVSQYIKQGYQVRKDSHMGEIHLLPPDRPKNQGLFRVLSQNGDDRIVWDRTSPDEVREAYTKFDDFIARKYTAYAIMRDGTRGPKIDAFDPGMEEILFVPDTYPG